MVAIRARLWGGLETGRATILAMESAGRLPRLRGRPCVASNGGIEPAMRMRQCPAPCRPLLSFDGVKIEFYFDEHPPPHFHAR
jgi:hypothetical protein